MNLFARAAVALALAAAMLGAGAASAQDRTHLDSERDKASYMVGMDVGKSIAPVAPDLDMAALQRAIRNAMDGGEPLIPQDKAKDARTVKVNGGHQMMTEAPDEVLAAFKEFVRP